MSSPYTFGSPRIPPVPQSTPVTSSKPYFLNKPRAPRPPVINPYDKFTQVEFDDWIGNITGSIRKALGHEADQPDRSTVEPESASAIFNTSSRNGNVRSMHRSFSDSGEEEEYESEGEGVNDSLADIRARYAVRLDKGKARDPTEGPGLSPSGKGDKSSPIEIDLDEDEAEEDRLLQTNDTELDSDLLDDEEVAQHLSFIQLPDDETEPPNPWQLPQTLRAQGEDDQGGSDEQSEEAESGSSSAEDEPTSDNVIELLSSDDDEGMQVPSPAQKSVVEDEDSGSEGEDISGNVGDFGELLSDEGEEAAGSSPVLDHTSRVSLLSDDDERINGNEVEDGSDGEEEEDIENEGAEDEWEGSEGDEEGSEKVEDESGQSRPDRKLSHEIIDLDSDVEEDQLDEDADNIQPVEDDTSFPPHTTDEPTLVEIRNPWLGPQTYAEDYYAGGPILSSPDGDTFSNPHLLGVNDDQEGFLTPEVVTPADDNERDSSAGDELDGQEQHLHAPQLVLGADSRSELPPEIQLTVTEAIEVYDGEASEDELNVSRPEDEAGTSPVPVQTQRDSNDATITDLSQQDEAAEQKRMADQADNFFLLEDVTEENDQTTKLMGIAGDSEKAAREAAAALDEAYEEMDAETHREGHPDERSRDERVSTDYRVLNVTVEEVTDEEEDLQLSGSVLPLGTSDLDIEIAFDDAEADIPSDDALLLQEQDTLQTSVDVDAEGPLAQTLEKDEHQAPPFTAEQVAAEPTQLADVIPIYESAAPSEQSPYHSPTLLPADLPLVELFDAAPEPEQQQLPTPPAELDEFSHRLVKHTSPESQPETMTTVEDEESKAEDEGVTTQQNSAAVSFEPSPVTTAIDLEKESAIAIDIEGESDVGLAPVTECNCPEQIGVDEQILDQRLSEDRVDYAAAAAQVASTMPIVELAVGMAIQDGIEKTVKEVVPSKAANEESVSLSEQQAFASLSQERSAVSLPVEEGSDAHLPPSPTVEEGPDDDVTDEDADGEVDPDLGISAINGHKNIHKWDDFADEVFDERLWDMGDPLTPPTDLNEDASASPVIIKEGSAERVVLEVMESGQVESTPSLANGVAESTLKSTGAVADEDDIASSREASPFRIVTDRPSRSASPIAVVEGGSISATPERSLVGSEKELYGAERTSTEPGSEAVGESDPFTKDVTLDPGADSATIPRLTSITPLKPSSPIPGLGAPLAEDTVLEAPDGEIPGLTWSKSLSLSSHDDQPTVLPRSASLPPTSVVYSPQMIEVAQEWLTTHVPFAITRRATEPVLFSDPYPYSLSTPGLDNAKDEAGDTEDEEEHGMSLSSTSTSMSLEKDSEREERKSSAETNQSVQGDLSTTVLLDEDGGQTESEDIFGLIMPQDFTSTDSYLLGVCDADQDRDADGDLDPDFMQPPNSAFCLNDDEGTAELTYDTGAIRALEVPSSSDKSKLKSSSVLVETVNEAAGVVEAPYSSVDSKQNSSTTSPGLTKGIASDAVGVLPLSHDLEQSSSIQLESAIEATVGVMEILPCSPESEQRNSGTPPGPTNEEVSLRSDELEMQDSSTLAGTYGEIIATATEETAPLSDESNQWNSTTPSGSAYPGDSRSRSSSQSANDKLAIPTMDVLPTLIESEEGGPSTPKPADEAGPGMVTVLPRLDDLERRSLSIPPEPSNEHVIKPEQLLANPEALKKAEVETNIQPQLPVEGLVEISEDVERGSNSAEKDMGQPKSLELPPGKEPQSDPIKQTDLMAQTSLPSLLPDSSSLREVARGAKQTTNGKRKRSSSSELRNDGLAESGDQTNRSRSPKVAQNLAMWPQNRSKRPRNVPTMNVKHEDANDSDQSSELSPPSDDDDTAEADSAELVLRSESAGPSNKTSAAGPSSSTTADAEHLPMLHKHGRKTQNKPPTPSKRPIQKAHSIPSTSRRADKHPIPPFASQRATRSNCRYRKISVPKEEDGPRVCFLVPGCSLGDEEVIEENEIEDLGPATFADSLRMVHDVESLFDSYLIGVLRQLVGVDLLREQEVFFLPAPGEQPPVRRTQLKKALSDKSSLVKKSSKSGDVDASNISTTRQPIASVKSPSSSKKPISVAGSTSTSVSAPRKGLINRDSLTPASLLSRSSDEEDNADRKLPKVKPKHITKTGKGKTTEQTSKGGKSLKRGRQLSGDTLAYKPHSDSEDDSSIDKMSTTSPWKRLQTSRKGIKRTHSGKSSTTGENTDGREAKKLKKDR